MSAAFFASQGDLEGLRFAFEKGIPLDALACAEAAAADSLACLTFLHEKNCPWDEGTTMSAARVGSIECLRYAYEHGCPVSEVAAELCSYMGHADCLSYILSTENFPVNKDNCLEWALKGYEADNIKLIRRLQNIIDDNAANIKLQDYIELCKITKKLFVAPVMMTL